MLRKQILSALNDLRKICTDVALGLAIKSKKPESTVVEESKKEPKRDGRDYYERGDYAGSADSYYQHRGSGRHGSRN